MLQIEISSTKRIVVDIGSCKYWRYLRVISAGSLNTVLLMGIGRPALAFEAALLYVSWASSLRG